MQQSKLYLLFTAFIGMFSFSTVLARLKIFLHLCLVFTVLLAPNFLFAEEILVDLGSSGTAPGGNWQTITDANMASTVNNLIDYDTGLATGVSYTGSSNWGDSFNSTGGWKGGNLDWVNQNAARDMILPGMFTSPPYEVTFDGLADGSYTVEVLCAFNNSVVEVDMQLDGSFADRTYQGGSNLGDNWNGQTHGYNPDDWLIWDNVVPAGGSITISVTGTNERLQVIRLGGSGVPLPVELSTFYAEVVKDGVMLHWRTSAEINNAGFYVYRDDQLISNLIAGQGTTTQAQSYTYLDRNVVPGKVYRYNISDVEQGTNNETFHSEIVVIADANVINNNEVPQNFVLHSAYPNPFNPTANIAFELPALSHVNLTIYDVSGKLVKSLVDDQFDVGSYTFQWNGTDDNNQGVESGVYLYRLEAGSFSETKQMTLLK